jgi:hypothetical protein
MHHVASSPLLSHSADRALIPSMGHSLLNRRINHDADSVTGIVDFKEAAQGDLAPITRLAAKDLSSLCPIPLGTPQPATVLSF